MTRLDIPENAALCGIIGHQEAGSNSDQDFIYLPREHCLTTVPDLPFFELIVAFCGNDFLFYYGFTTSEGRKKVNEYFIKWHTAHKVGITKSVVHSYIRA